MATANITLDARHFKSTPERTFSEMEISTVIAKYALISIDSVQNTATEGAINTESMTLSGNNYTCILNNLQNNAYYSLDIEVTNPRGTTKPLRKMYIDTTNQAVKYIIRQQITGPLGVVIPDANLVLTPQLGSTINFDRWITELRVSATPVDLPTTPAELFTYLTSKITSNATLVTTSNSSGHFLFPNIPAGNYTLQISKAGFQTRTIGLVVDKNFTSGTYPLTTQ
jgi:hypothetical protein